ncbi:uncharacterized protein T551_02001 [Pneumocystis jirovecii RU7]|uniref:Chalcone isomerase domain-containing protein n=1 Tax=Pneumocystis jirovecii (strain RU7) TaxID=1408657 RepID=A0A0W4ZNU2_PNEJ7|nr:uncharacterized protein T551_02001 [Pneumocystis jirovecii RU7]KTW30057.1 hypothetical protein T551_02001 [Pneumocystis jirovecii RU7]
MVLFMFCTRPLTQSRYLLQKQRHIFTKTVLFPLRCRSTWVFCSLFGFSFFPGYFMYRNIFHSAKCDATISQDIHDNTHTTLVKTSSSTVPFFPKFITPDSSSEQYILLGLGTRTVTFLGIKVYVAGIYIPSLSLPKVQSILQKYISEEPNNSAQNLSILMQDSTKSMSLISSLLESKVKFIIRIVPTRNTKFSHLRDGFIHRISNQVQTKSTEYSSDDLVSFKSIWPTQQKLLKGEELLLFITNTHTIQMIYNSQKIATFIGNDAIVKSILYSYLCGKHIISEEIRKNTVQGFINLVLEP